jgi:uncharacterized coiled-coil DUF342 family protein
MNALIHEKCEDPVVPQEMIELHIAPLRKGLDEVKADVRELRADHKGLRDKLDTVHTTLLDKIDTVQTTLRDRIDQSHASLSAGQAALRDRMDEGFRASNAKIDSVSTTLNEKIAKLSDAVTGMRGLQKAMLWMIGGVGSLATILITMGKALHWF